MMFGKSVLAVLTLVAGLVMSHAGPALADGHGAEANKIFVVISSAEPQTQGMGFILATQAMMRGAEVRILLCGPGGDVALKGHNSPLLKPMDKSPQMMLAGLVAKGVTAQVCGLYLPNAGVGPDALIEGVTPVKPPVMSDYMVQPGVRYFTF